MYNEASTVYIISVSSSSKEFVSYKFPLSINNKAPMSSQFQDDLPSNTKFGWLLSAVFAGLSIYLLSCSAQILAIFSLSLCLIFGSLASISPKLLMPLNFLWFRVGLCLGKIISPIVLGSIFFTLLTPVSLATRLFGRDELKIKKRITDTYWIERLPQGSPVQSFKNQY